MSRIIVKNLPKGTKDEKLRELFSQKGEVTDLSMKYTKNGVFRNFAFIGFKSEKSALQAIKHFNNTYFNSTKMQVELAKDFGDKTKPRAWSKYSSESSSNQKKAKAGTAGEKQAAGTDKKLAGVERKKKAKDEKMKEFLGELGDDPEFKEFLEVHENSSRKSTWSNDTSQAAVASPDKQMKKRNDVTFDDESSSGEEDKSEDSDDDTSDDRDNEKDVKQSKPAAKTALSDLEYLKTMMTSSVLLSESDDSDEEYKEDTKSKKQKLVEGKVKKKKKGSKPDSSDAAEDDSGKTTTPRQVEDKPRYVAKIRGLYGKYNEKLIKEFFQPLSTVSIKLPRNARKNLIGVAFVEFTCAKDLDQALRKNKSLINGKRISMKRTQEEADLKVTEHEPRAWELKIQQDRAEEDEGIAESGRLFVRNLAYCCTEDDIHALFNEYGPLTDVSVPVDPFTHKIKGFAHVTFMMPEHAVKGFVALDGTVFQGRMLHILPGKPKPEDIEITEKTSFKKKKEAEQKSMAKSSHNWNTMFIGANAVADTMAERYGTSKSQILDASGKESLGVRMALGETQIVSETRDFLLDNGVSLDSFSQAAAPRSKTVILAKNLPAGTNELELREKFEKYGTLGRFLLPPARVSALIEFLEPAQARSAFTKLAYTKFQYLPLYLEWAPVGVFTTEYKAPPTEEMEEEEEETEKEPTAVDKEEIKKVVTEEGESDDEDEEERTPGCTLFVKNLNFDTTEEDFKTMFERCGNVKYATISKKKDFKNPGEFLSMGYGFVEYTRKSSADKALKTLQHASLDDHQLELKISNRETTVTKESNKKKQKSTKQKSSKILVRNIPFEVTRNEIYELFKVFGELKTVRLPKKLSGTGSHRGFGFVDFLTRPDAKRAFNALCHSTHLFGRRLVLEWAEAEETVDDLRRKTAERFHDDGPSKKLRKSSIMEDLAPS
ncbi:probable RNA-binding protein 19 [Haliotis rubra]|uniref:probable RNA-binding protein 19 n=1 Tax=Haliotis rubra TaxID=36100 RepID=UPI001EE5D2C4|nr:probable RNA-binding protein 19 [Haliotis rubra]